MAKIDLSERIKITIAGFGVLLCLYFVIAIWLKSDGMSFNPETTYELLKDTLTLGAAFLAPVAAFVLFSDWREQHVECRIESICEEVWIKNEKILRGLELLIQILEQNNMDGFEDKKVELRGEIDEVKAKINTLVGYKHKEVLEFEKLGVQINKRMLDKLNKLETIKNTLNSAKKFRCEKNW